MEIKCKVSFTLPEDLIEALGIDEDTPIIATAFCLKLRMKTLMKTMRFPLSHVGNATMIATTGGRKTIPTIPTTFTTVLTMTADRTVPAMNANTSARTAATVFSCEGGGCHE